MAHTEGHNYTLRSGWILGVDLTCIKVYLTLEKTCFLLLLQLYFFFLVPGRVFILIMLNADFLVSISSLVHTLKCQRIKQMFFALSEKKYFPALEVLCFFENYYFFSIVLKTP